MDTNIYQALVMVNDLINDDAYKISEQDIIDIQMMIFEEMKSSGEEFSNELAVETTKFVLMREGFYKAAEAFILLNLSTILMDYMINKAMK